MLYYVRYTLELGGSRDPDNHARWYNICDACYPQRSVPDSKVHGVNMGPTWDRRDPGGPHVGHVKLAIWGYIASMSVERVQMFTS